MRLARRAAPALEVALASSIADHGPVWDQVVPPAQVLNRAAYLGVLERSLATSGVRSLYALVWRGGTPMAACTFHVLRVERLGLTLLVAGNLVTTGAPALVAADGIGDELAAAALVSACEAAQSHERRHLGALVLKDVPDGVCARTLTRAGFRPLAVEPSMRLDLRPSWQRLDDYARDLRSKYRRRLRGMRQSAAHLERRPLDAAAARRHRGTIDRLYAAVHGRARHAGPRLGGDHFVALAAVMAAPAYELIGYFEDGALIGWNSRYRVGDDLASSFFGFDRTRADGLALFRNLMVDDLEHALATGARSVHFGRTTHAIKSELGAVPEHLACYVRPLSPLAHPLCWVVRTLARAPQWTARQPFTAPR